MGAVAVQPLRAEISATRQAHRGSSAHVLPFFQNEHCHTTHFGSVTLLTGGLRALRGTAGA